MFTKMQEITMAVFGLEPKDLIGRVIQVDIPDYDITEEGMISLDVPDEGGNCVITQITALRMNGPTLVAEVSIREVNNKTVQNLQIQREEITLEVFDHRDNLAWVPVVVRLA